MAKKQKEKTFSSPSTNTSKLNILTYFRSENEDAIKNIQVLTESGLETGSVSSIVAVCLTEKDQKEITQTPELKESISSGFLITTVTQKGKLNEEAIALMNEDWICILEPGVNPNLTELFRNHSINKRKSKSEVYVGNKLNNKSKNPLGGRITGALYNFVSRMLTPIRNKNINCGQVIIKNTSECLKALSSVSIKSGFTSELLYTLRLLDKHPDEIVGIYNDNKPYIGYASGSLNILLLSFKMRFKWFVSEPLNFLRGKAKNNLCTSDASLSVVSGKHPLYRLLFGAAFLLSLVFVPILSQDYNLTWDEPLHSEYAADMVEYYKTLGEDTSVFNLNKRAYGTMLYYGSSFDFIAEVVHSTIPVLGIYEMRHVLNSLFGLIGILFAALLARRMSNWRSAFLCFIFLIFSPSFFGQIMNNPKDIPFASSFIMGAYFIFLLVKELPKPSFKNIIGCVLSIAWAMSIRPGGLLLVGFLGAFVGLDWLYLTFKQKLKHSGKLFIPYVRLVVIISVVGFFLGLILWPYALRNPIKNPFIALEQMTNFSFLTIYELFDGVKMFKDKPWYYLPKTIMITAPLFVLAGILLSVLGFGKGKKEKYNLFFLLFLIVFPPAYAIYQDSLLYNGWRHMLFIYPPLIVLSASGWEYLIQLLKRKAAMIGVFILIAAGIGNVTIWMIKYHPLEYLYYNEVIGGVKGAYGNYETDYWCQSTRPAVEWLLENRPEIKNKKTLITTNNEFHSVQYHVNKVSDSIRVSWSREMEWNKQYWDYAIWTTRTLSGHQLKEKHFPPKGTIHVVEVEGVPIAAVVERQNTFMPDGYKYFQEGKYKEAAESFQKATAFDPNDEEGFRSLGWAQFFLGDYESSIRNFQRSIDLRPDNFFSYGFMGAAYMRKGDNDNALKALKASVYHKVNNSMAYEVMGDIYFNQKSFDLAIQNYELTMQHGGQSAGVYNKIGKCFVGKYGLDPKLGKSNLENALAYFNAATQIDPNFPEPYYTMGMILIEQGKKKEGEALVQKAQALMGQK